MGFSAIILVIIIIIIIMIIIINKISLPMAVDSGDKDSPGAQTLSMRLCPTNVLLLLYYQPFISSTLSARTFLDFVCCLPACLFVAFLCFCPGSTSDVIKRNSSCRYYQYCTFSVFVLPQITALYRAFVFSYFCVRQHVLLIKSFVLWPIRLLFATHFPLSAAA